MTSQRLRLHLRIAAVTGIPYAVLWAAWMYVFELDTGGTIGFVLAALAGGLLFGVIMSAILGTRQWRAGLAVRDRR